MISLINPKLSNAQPGLRPRRSILSNVMNLSIAALDVFANRQQLDVFYGDFENAFDKVVHLILLGEFWKFVVGMKTAKWFF